ncbi:MAG: lysophospholipase, partial [Muribaculaceae bacterium]|nr:lysophospholipase [Muribaculaceae bacterium]
MKRIATAIVSMFAGIVLAYAQTGTWTGELEVQGMKIPLVLHLGGENPTMDSPNQGAKGISMQPTMPTNDSIFIKIPAIGATLAGRMEGDKIVGTFTQRGYELPIILYPGERTIVRPQTPKPPFPYTQEEVSFTNGDAILKGTLTLPDGYSKDTPVLIMITGSGLQNRDEEIMEHKPFAVIADALARNGIATLRYDDRGYGESTGDAVNCTTEDLMRDALAGIKLLRQRFDKVGVLGHSEGGTIALMLGANKNVDFLV